MSMAFFFEESCDKKCSAMLAACGQNSFVELMKAGTCPTSASGVTFSIFSFLRGKHLCLVFCSLPFWRETPNTLPTCESPGSVGYCTAFPATLQSHLWFRGTLPFSRSGVCPCYHLCVALLHPVEMPDMGQVDFTYGARTIGISVGIIKLIPTCEREEMLPERRDNRTIRAGSWAMPSLWSYLSQHLCSRIQVLLLKLELDKNVSVLFGDSPVAGARSPCHLLIPLHSSPPPQAVKALKNMSLRVWMPVQEGSGALHGL